MKKKSLPSFEEYREEFMRVLDQQYQKEPLITRILGDSALSQQSALLLWEFANGSSDRLVRHSRRWTAYRDSQFRAAIRGVEAVANLYPRRAHSMSKIKSELLRDQRKLTSLPAKARGRHDWPLLLHIKDKLESALGCRLPDATLTALLNAAFVASGQQEKKFDTVNAVRNALARLSARLAH